MDKQNRFRVMHDRLDDTDDRSWDIVDLKWAWSFAVKANKDNSQQMT